MSNICLFWTNQNKADFLNLSYKQKRMKEKQRKKKQINKKSQKNLR
jgi:hypothetical protein